MKIKVCQIPVLQSIDANFNNILSALKDSKKGEWLVFPEGVLSGYYPEDPEFISKLNLKDLQRKIEEIKKYVVENELTCILGSVTQNKTERYNSTLIINSSFFKIYTKLNLSFLDRNHFSQGNILNTFELNGVTVGVQMCREVLFPEQWSFLKQKGAQIIFHINNAVKEKDAIWEHLLITRALENQVWVCSVNNPAVSQNLPSMIINPLGEIVWKSSLKKNEIALVDIDLAISTDYYQKQKRTDIVKIIEG